MLRRIDLGKIVVCLGVVAAAFVPGVRPADGRESGYEVLARQNVMVPMRDGVKLATDIYLPARNGAAVEGRFPVVLSRTPYGKVATIAECHPKHYVPFGYIVVRQDTRGRGGSEGIWHWMSDDRQDGYDAIEWIAEQPWSDGKIGMMGCSYVGATQHLAAMTRPPHLTTITPADPSINHGIGATIYGGAFRLRVWDWIFDNAAEGSRQARDPAMRAALEQQSKDRRHYLLNLPLRRGLTPLRIASEYEDMLIDMLEHRRNDEFWRFSNIIQYAGEHKDLPVFMIGGWYDLFSSGTTETWLALRKTIQGPVHLIMGPWIHHMQGRSHGQVDFGPDAVVDMSAMRRAWFDRWLKNGGGDLHQNVPFRTPVRMFVMGTGDGHKTEAGLLYHGGYWRDEADYPLPRAKPTNYYLHAGGGLSPEPAAEKKASTAFQFDPRNPVPTIGGCTCCARKIMTDGAWNQWGGEHTWAWPVPLPLSARNDVVVFTTPPLAEDTEIIGPIHVKLWASSSAVDTDFTAKLIDVYPSSPDFPAGFDLIMGDGIIRARYRDSDQQEKLMTPGEVYPFHIKLDPCCNVFKKGHRIRVDVSSSNFPRFDVNPNTGEPANDYRRMITAVNTIYHDAERPSHILLPLVPRAEARAR
ncbi:MAG: CocE/NonD family hydrolase [Candidatus Anammoximicrobium sp.]|nr:CocE/NonD family hydrolase [Candidatus Anammoximicrobium sp.]